MASPTLVDYSVTNTTFNTTLAASFAGFSWTAGDIIFIIASCDAGHTMTLNDGTYTQLYGLSNSTYCTQYCWYKVSGVTETAPTVTISGSSEPIKIVAISVNGWDSSALLYTTATGNDSTITAPDINVLTDSLAIRSCVVRNSNNTLTTPATEIEKGHSGSLSSTQIYTGESQDSHTGVGSIGALNFTSIAVSRYIVASIAIHGSGGTPASTITDWDDPWYSTAEGFINGSNFEASQGTGTVTLVQGSQSAAMTVSSWSDGELEVVAPNMLATSLHSGDTTLTVDPDTNTASTKLLQFEYSVDHRYVNIVALASNVNTRIEATSLAQDWQLLYSKYLYDSSGTNLLTDYLVEVRDDATFTIAGQPPDGTYKLPVVEYNNTSHTWGAFVNQTIIVDIGIETGDTTAPVVTAPTDLTITISSDSPGVFHTNTTLVNWIATATAADAVDGTITTITTNLSTKANPLPTGATTLIFSATDVAGNTGTDTAVVTVVVLEEPEDDTTAPTVTAPSNLTITFPYGQGGLPQSNTTLIAWLGSATAFDDVDGNLTADIENTAGTLLDPIPAGVYPITWSVSDAAGNEGSDTANLTITQDSSGFMSGSTDFVVTCGQIIEDAYRNIGCLAEGETLTSYRETFALRQLNMMIKSWTTKGYHLWTILHGLMPLVPGQRVYTIGAGGDYNIARPLRILQASYREGLQGNETPLKIISQRDYRESPDYMTSTGRPNELFYFPDFTGSSRTPKGGIYLKPIPSTAEAGGYISFTYSQYIQDIDNCPGDDVPLPVEWADALVWNLALRLCGSENVSAEDFARTKTMADQFLQEVNEDDNDVTTGIQMMCGED